MDKCKDACGNNRLDAFTRTLSGGIQTMTHEELKAEAKKQGYTLQKIPAFHCSCYLPYPNELHRFKNGKCKCDNYYPIKYKQRSMYDPVTHCRRKE